MGMLYRRRKYESDIWPYLLVESSCPKASSVSMFCTQRIKDLEVRKVNEGGTMDDFVGSMCSRRRFGG
jgi:hypothetical protein